MIKLPITSLAALSVIASLLLSSCMSVEQNSSSTTHYKKSSGGNGRVNPMVMKNSTRKNTRLVIDIRRQKAFLLVDGKVGLVSPVSTARAGKYTPRGTFRMSERVRSGKISTIYNVSMPYWMRLSGTVFGVHAGYLPGYPASAGCIRLPANMAQKIYENTTYGTRVSIYNSWNGA
jgi:lipoprotein-anchoring transpeptidase ErfK/SrfK